MLMLSCSGILLTGPRGGRVRRQTLIGLVAAVGATVCLGCTSVGVTPLGSAHYAPLPASQDVQVFSSEAEVKQPFEPVAIISYTNPGKYQVLTLQDAIPELKQKAREVGANAIIIEQTRETKSGLISTGVAVNARTIRVATPSSPP
jgi:hypothetical protein